MHGHGPPAIAEVLLSLQGRAALAAGAIGMLICLLRQALGWTQQDLAERSGYSQATISRVERGVTRAARDTTVAQRRFSAGEGESAGAMSMFVSITHQFA